MRQKINIDSNSMNFEGRQETARRDEGESKEMYVKGSKEEDRRKYREFLEYCEERRKEHKRSMEDETDRKLKAAGKTASWELFSQLPETEWRKVEDKEDRGM